MRVSKDTLELGNAVGKLLRNDGAGAQELLSWHPKHLAQKLEQERLGGHVDQLLRSVDADAYVGSAHEAALAPLVGAMQFDWLRREEALSQLLALFEQNGIRAAFLKGTVWAETIYQRPFDRSASDIDILISEQDALHFHQVMKRAGYRYRDDKHTFASNEFGYHPRDDAYPFQIDVHWSLCDLYGQEPKHLDGAFTRAVAWTNKSSHNAMMLAPLDDILWQCWHRTSTQGDVMRLRSLIDLSLLTHKYYKAASTHPPESLSEIERAAVMATFSDTATILGQDAIPDAWEGWIIPAAKPYSQAQEVLAKRRRFRSLRHRLKNAHSWSDSLKCLHTAGMPPKRWYEVNTGNLDWGRYLYTCGARLVRGAHAHLKEYTKP